MFRVLQPREPFLERVQEVVRVLPVFRVLQPREPFLERVREVVRVLPVFRVLQPREPFLERVQEEAHGPFLVPQTQSLGLDELRPTLQPPEHPHRWLLVPFHAQ